MRQAPPGGLVSRQKGDTMEFDIWKIEKAINVHEGQYHMYADAGFDKIAAEEYNKVKGIVEVLVILGYEVEHVGGKAIIVKKEAA